MSARSRNEMVPEEQALWSPEKVAQRYGVTSKTVIHWFERGVISAEVAVGKVYRFDPAKVAKELKPKPKGPKPPPVVVI